MSRPSVEPRWSCLRRYAGLRVNVFRAMHDRRFFLADDNSVIATRMGDYALTATVSFDQSFHHYYVRDCNWYRSDLSRLADEDVPEQARHELLRVFLTILN